jgi:hypothetical protein
MARWHSCNILSIAPDAKRVWQFDAKGGGFAFDREQQVAHTEKLPARGIAKNWVSLWQPKLNVAWLSPENVFLRVVELPASPFEETLSMVELQLEKLSPLPVTQIVWTVHVMGTYQSLPKADGTVEHLQAVVVVIAGRAAVEEFLGRLEQDGYLADRLETPLLDQLAAVTPTDDGAWLFPFSLGGQNAAMVAWWSGGALRNLSLVTLPAAGDRGKELRDQLAHIVWSGELEGWLVAPPKWHLVADPANATEWETVLRAGLNEPVPIIAPPTPVELAARTAQRAAVAEKSNLLPEEFSTRYHEQFIDRLWLRGLLYAGVAYVLGLVVYFCAVGVLGFQTHQVESAVAKISGSYTNAMQLKSRLAVLQERSQLKYAALDCWQTVAEALPPGVNIQRFSFTDGKRLALSGSCSQDHLNLITDPNAFYDGVRKARLNGQPMFGATPETSDQLIYRNQGKDSIVWNFGLELLHTEKEPEAQ